MFKNRYIFIRNVVLLTLVCNTLYWLFPFRPVVWRLLLVLLASYITAIERKRLPFENAVLFFIALNVVHFIISFLWITPNMTIFGNILCAMLSLSLFTGLAEKGVITDQFIAFAGITLVATAIPYYYHMRIVLLEMTNSDLDADITNNGSTLFLMILPLIFLMKNNIQKWATLMVCLFFILLSAKRGNILAAILPSALFVYTELRGGKHSILKTFLVIAAVIIAGYFVYIWSINNDYLIHRLEQTAEGNTSERDIIYAGAWDAWYNSNSVLHFFFGYGFEGTLSISGMEHNRAHNDWLEILVDYGLFGAIFYVAIFISLYKQIRRTKVYTIKLAIISATLVWLFKTLYSMGFTEPIMSILMITLGTALGRYKRREVVA